MAARNDDLYTGEPNPDALNLVVRAVERCERDYHDEFVRKVEKRYLSYRGLVEQTPDDDSDDWRSQVTPPYVLQTCEGMLATMLEPHPRFDVQPRPRPEEPLEEVLQRVTSIEAISDTLGYALDRDQFAQRQRSFMQQDMVAGISVLKSYWRTEEREVTKLAARSLGIVDSFGQQYDSVTVYSETEQEPTMVVDDACCEVVDVRDFFWPSQSPSVEKAEFLIHRTYETYASLRRKQDDGYYDYRNVDKLKPGSSPTGAVLNSELTAREMRLRNVDRTKDLIEVLEYWTPERVITVGNRAEVLKDRPNPLWMGRMPFIVCSGMPDAFQIPGLSVVEALAQLQEMLWTLQNQRLDVVRMLANVITLVRSDVDDPDSAYVYEPGAKWLVEDPGQVTTLPIDPSAANITLQAEALLKGDLQNIMGGLPMNSGVDSQNVDQQTATGVSIITTIAQRLIQARKQHYLWAYATLGKHFLLLYQQFLREERVVRIVGAPGAQAYRKITPLQIQGDYDVMVDVTSDSLNRQERRAEAQSLLQIAAQTQPIFAQSGAPLNLKAFMEKALDAYNVIDKERYFLPKQAAPAIGQPPGQPGQQPMPQERPMPQGITNPALAAGLTSPSNENSLSPEAAMQRMLSMSGGPANGGGGG